MASPRVCRRSIETFESYFVFVLLAKIHCIADVGSLDREKHARQHTELIPFNIIPLDTETAIRDAFVGKEEVFIKDMVQFAMVSRMKEEIGTVNGSYSCFRLMET